MKKIFYLGTMRMQLSIFLLVCLATALSAKDKRSYSSLPSTQDTVILKLKEELKRNQLPYNGILNAITTKPLPPAFIGNNGKGFDVYESRVDNMAILKPDNSFTSNMPVAKTQWENTQPISGFSIPRNKMDGLLEKIKKGDSLFMQPAKPKIYHYPKK